MNKPAKNKAIRETFNTFCFELDDGNGWSEVLDFNGFVSALSAIQSENKAVLMFLSRINLEDLPQDACHLIREAKHILINSTP